ncbi:MAG: polyprenyl synthetase family protein [Candidatus Aminicenantes bacterium]|nr:polyprenyl synthetase family protein [Candidatus Aminicenantes bacterium]
MNDYLQGLTAAVDRELLSGIDPRRGTLEAAMHYALTVSGKRLRPLLFLALLDACGKEALRHIGLASALEIIHTYSLIHDDLPAMDDDDLRRGMPTVHRKFNEAVALLAGDTLLTFAFEKIAAAHLPPVEVVAVMRIVTGCIGKEGMALGQALDLEFSGRADVIATIHRLKTAELIRGALQAAGVVAGFDRRRQKIAGKAGIALGLGFQLADDLLDVAGDEKLAGKKLHKDKDNRSPNAVLYFGLETVREMIDSRYREAQGFIDELGISFPPFLALTKGMLYRSH